MPVNEARLTVFPGSLEYRFAWGGRGTPAPVPAEEILADLQGMDLRRCQRIVLAGGSPLAHPDFVELAKVSGTLGVPRLGLETDAGPLARKGMPKLLERLGFTELFAVLGGLREEVHAAVLGGTGPVETALGGLESALAYAREGSGPRVYMIVPLLRSNVDDLDPLLDWAIGLGGLQGVLLALPEIARVPVEHRGALLPYAAQAQIAARLFRKCQGHNVEYGLTSKRGLLPCAADGALEHFATVFFDRSQYFKHAPRNGAGEEFARVDACAECSLNQGCPGVERAYLDHFGAGEFKAVPLDVSMDWKLRRINRLEDFEYRNVSPFENDSPVNPRGLIRINGHCNMSCAFCFVDRTAPDFAVEGLQEEIRRMAEGGTRHLVLSGGEPTLHPQLPELIAYARSRGAFDVIEMQSNGVKCADMDYARQLAEAGLNKVTFSLHSADADHSDAITRLPRAFGKTIESIHNFRQLGLLTQIAHVITKANYRELPETMRFLRREFPADGGHLSVCLAIAQGISDLVFQWVIPTFTEIKPHVAEALDFCLENEIGFGGMIGQGGYPPCMLDGDLRYYEGVLDKVFRSGDSSDQFYKSEKCRECSFDAYCLGPRRSYVEHYGDAEIRPFQAEIRPPARRGGSVEFADDSVGQFVAAAPGRSPAEIEAPPRALRASR